MEGVYDTVGINVNGWSKKHLALVTSLRRLERL